MNEIKAIETTYAGIKFRSRLEARWAVFFDELQLEWCYEQEGYDLPPVPRGTIGESIKYLPDFVIRSQRLFPKEYYFEVKPEGKFDSLANEKAIRLAYHLDASIGVLQDVPFPDDTSDCNYGVNHSEKLCNLEFLCVVKEGHDYGYCFCECPFCNKFGFTFNGRSARIGCGCDHSQVANGDKTYNNASPDLIAAYALARSSRFELYTYE